MGELLHILARYAKRILLSVILEVGCLNVTFILAGIEPHFISADIIAQKNMTVYLDKKIRKGENGICPDNKPWFAPVDRNAENKRR